MGKTLINRIKKNKPDALENDLKWIKLENDVGFIRNDLHWLKWIVTSLVAIMLAIIGFTIYLHSDVKTKMRSIRTEMKTEMRLMKTEINSKIDRLNAKIDQILIERR